MNIFNGERAHLASTEARRKIDIDTQFEEVFPELSERKKHIIDSGFEIKDEYFESGRGLSLGTRTFIPPEEVLENKGNIGIIYVHGYTDNVRWGTMRITLKLAEQGYFVTAIEHEGHGLSDTTAGLVSELDLVTQDLHDFIKHQQEKYPMKRWFIFGESFGGMLTILESIKFLEVEKQGEVNLDGMILLAPMCKIADNVKPNSIVVGALSLLAKVFPTLSLVPTDLDESIILKNKTIIEKHRKDPIKYVGRPRLATALAMLNSCLWLENNFDKVTLPFIVLHGKKDIVTSPEGSIELYEKCKVPEDKKKLILSEEGWHALLSAEPEEDMDSYWKSIFEWIEEMSN